MLVNITNFQGEFPKVANQLLADNAAKSAIDCRFLSGSLDSWHQKTLIADAICKTGNINTVYLMDDQYWLQWNEGELGSGHENVDVARGPISQDTTERTIFTGTDAPRVTNIELATGSTGCYPQASYLLGVPAPEEAPTLVINPDDAAENEVELNNPDAEDGTTAGWVSTGSFAAYDDNDIVGLLPQEGDYFFGSGNVASTTFQQDISLASSGAAEGQQLTLTWWQASGAGNSTAYMDIVFLNGIGAEVGRISGTNQAINPDNTWAQQSISGAIVSTTETIRLYGVMTRVGGTMDAYVDNIILAVTNSDFSSDGSSLEPFQRSPEQSSRSIIVDGSTFAAPYGNVFRMQADEKTNYLYKNFALSSASSFTVAYDFRWEDSRNEHHLVLGATQSGVGQGLKFRRGEGPKGLRRSTYSSLDDTGSGDVVLQDPGGLVSDQWYRMNVVATKSGDSLLHLVITVTNKTSLVDIVDEVETDIAFYGDWVNWKHWSNEGGGTARMYIDNINVTTIPALSDEDGAAVFTNYVYTYVNEYGEEGPPSPVSDTIQFPDGGSVVLTFDDAEQPNYNLENGVSFKRIYRAATANGVTSFLFVDEIPFEDTTYIDTKEDFELGEELQTVDWDLPPTDGKGVIALPNGVTAMFSKNQLCPSVINRLHAYPVAYRLNFDSNVVAIAPIDTSVVVATETYPYLVVGSDPSQMSSAKFEQRQACVSKRSMVSIRNYGVIYASPDGLVAINGAGGITLITDAYFSREEWQELEPETIVAFAHDDRYYAYYGDGEGGFCFDPRKGGNGLTFLSEWFRTGYSDPKTDMLNLVAEDNELYIWDDLENATKLSFDWTSKNFRLPRAGNFRAYQVRAESYANLTFRFYSNGVLVHTQAVTSEAEKVMPPNTTTYTEVRLTGTDRVWQVQCSEEMEELQ